MLLAAAASVVSLRQASGLDSDPETPLAVNVAAGVGAASGPETLQFSTASYKVGEVASSASIKVTRTNPSAAPVTVHYAASDGTAIGDEDYARVSGTLTFAANQKYLIFSVPILKDTADEADETVLLSLNGVVGGAVFGAPSTAVLTITDNDSAGKIRFSTATYGVAEGGTAAAITVKRLGGLAGPVTVNYSAAPGTASSPTDFTAVAGTLTFDASGPGATTRTFAVPIGAVDGASEGIETVDLTLSSPGQGATLGTPATAVLRIADGDPTLELGSIAYSVKESAPSALITVKRSGPPSGAVTVHYSTGGGNATADADYEPVSGTLTFGSGVTARSFAVPILKDTVDEPNETINLGLDTPSGIGLGHATAAALTIVDDDKPPTLQFSAPSYSVHEASPKATISVKRSGNLAGTVSVAYTVTDAATTAGSDYTVTPNPGTLTFGPGVATRTFSVSILNDTSDEGSEEAVLSLGGTTGGAVIGAVNPAILTILDNEPTTQFSAAKYTVSETAAHATITVRRTGNLTAQASVAYAAASGTATSGLDYSLTPGVLTFGPRVASRTFSVALMPDTVDEPNETIQISLSNPSSVSLGTPDAATLTITDNDAAGKVQFGAPTYSVSEAGGSATITVTRTGGTASAASVSYATANGSATEAQDYTARSGILTFDFGETQKTFTIPITDDAAVEANETVLLTLGSPGGNLVLGSPTAATLWIVDQDQPSPPPPPPPSSPLSSSSSQATSFSNQRKILRLSNGTQAFVFQQGKTTAGLTLAISRDDGQTFPQTIHLVPNKAVYADVLRMPNDDIALVYSGNADITNSAADVGFLYLEYRPSTDDWAIDQTRTSLVFDAQSSTAGYNGVIAFDGVRLWAAFRHVSGTQWSAQVKYSNDLGASWNSSITEVDTPGPDKDETAVFARRSNGTLALIYYHQNSAFKWRWRHDTDTPTTWQSSELIRTVSTPMPSKSAYSVVVDNGNSIHLVFNESGIRHLVHNGTAWQATPTVLTASGSYPTLTSNGSDLWAVWENKLGTNQFQLIYKKYKGSTQSWDTQPSMLTVASQAPLLRSWWFSAASQTFRDVTDAANTRATGDAAPSPGDARLQDMDDALYFGQSAPFDYLRIQLQTPGEGGAIEWQYASGDDWITFVPESGPCDFTQNASVRLWTEIGEVPSSWTPASVNGSSPLYYVRARVHSSFTTAATGIEATTVGQNRYPTSILSDSSFRWIAWTEGIVAPFRVLEARIP